ncbi:MAG: leucine-rich repeat domain-containing protein, partial [Spirochaetota bacterium]|nr:leucine-rich repeat domain-containing protein [Spirochaetota bacterium]
NLRNLKSLFLWSNNISKIPTEIGKLEKLELLYLWKNNLTTLPDEIKNLKRLKRLDIKRNPLSEKEKERIKSLLPNVNVSF